MTAPGMEHMTLDLAVPVGRSRQQSSVQWRVASLHLCNWGGFGGRHTVTFDADATLLAGASGAGKSTVLDAVTLLLQPPNTALNTASNETTGGPRNRDGKRTALTYVRGQYGWSEGRDGLLHPKLLRGADQDTWSALALVFAADNGDRYTVLRLFYATRSTTSPTEIPLRLGVYDGVFDLSDIEAWARQQFPIERMRRAYPGLEFPPSYRQLAERFQARLGIGEHGDGARAMRLLANIQRGQRFDTVHDLYRTMVLERPATFERADIAVASFDRLDDAHRQMRRAEEQLEMLSGMVEDHDRLVDAQDTIVRIDEYRADDSHSPFALWWLRHHADLFEQEIGRVRGEKAAAEADVASKKALMQSVESRQAEVERQWLDAGGAQLGDYDAKLAEAQAAQETVFRARAEFADAVAPLNLAAPDNTASFATMQQDAAAFLTDFDHVRADVTEQRDEAVREAGDARRQQRQIENEIESLSSRRGNIDELRHQTRLRFAHAAGLDVDQLPFVGELLDMDPGHERWRGAADAVLGGFARTLLVDERHRHALRRAINSLTESMRLSYIGVNLDAHDPGPVSEQTLAGRLVVQDGPFAGWLRAEVNSRFDYECVETADELGDDDVRRVTRTGQTQAGRRGAHGGHQQRVIGFSNTARIAELQADADALQPTIDEAGRRADELNAQSNALFGRKAAWESVARAHWDALDLTAAQARVTGLQEDRRRLLAQRGKGQQETLEALTGLRADLKDARDDALGNVKLAEEAVKGHHNRWTALVVKQDEVLPRLWALEDDPAVTLRDDQAGDLDGLLADNGWTGDYGQFSNTLQSNIKRRLTERQSAAQDNVTTLARSLTNRFKNFHERWPDNNRLYGLDSYDDYLAIFETLTEQGLAAQRASWARKVIEWGGEDLSELRESYDTTFEEITERMAPINKILETIPFGGARSTLRIDVERATPLKVREFKDKLRHLASGSMNPNVTDEQITTRFEDIRVTIDRIRKTPERTSPEYDELLDVRRHITIRAHQLNGSGDVEETYVHISDKSGGESQELIAFIVGSALRYQLGDQHRNRPRFAPVFLDEGFIKADSRHAQRAVAAWHKLGFQLIIGAPEGQFSALEKAMNRVIAITKDSAEQSYAVPIEKAPDPTHTRHATGSTYATTNGRNAP